MLKCNERCIASGVFFVISIKDKEMLPDYVAAFLNSSAGQKALSVKQNTAGVQSITRTELEQIDIPLIPLEKQKQIVEMFLLYEKEVDIMEKIKKNRKKIINSMLGQIIKE